MTNLMKRLIMIFPFRRVLSPQTGAVLALLLLSGMTGAARGQSPTALEGAWERTFVRVILPDTTIEQHFDSGSRLIKILIPGRFAFGQQSEDGQEVLAGGGRYTLAGDVYTEVIDYHSSAWLVGRSIPFDSRLEDDVWQISGVIGRFRLEETWRRLP